LQRAVGSDWCEGYERLAWALGCWCERLADCAQCKRLADCVQCERLADCMQCEWAKPGRWIISLGQGDNERETL
jgi:hypothetical protein